MASRHEEEGDEVARLAIHFGQRWKRHSQGVYLVDAHVWESRACALLLWGAFVTWAAGVSNLTLLPSIAHILLLHKHFATWANIKADYSIFHPV